MPPAIPRRIVLFLDGTWNSNDGTSAPTNIVRMHEALKTGVNALTSVAVDPPDGSFGQGSVVEGRSGTFEYVVRYDSGVGTGLLDRYGGGILGRGLDDNIRQAYRFLSWYYRPGDEIHVFGFSRGAYTARSIVGYLGATGLLQAEHCTAEHEARTWRHYRTSPDDRPSGEWHALQPLMHPSGSLTVKSVGVFDTVGALGIPGNAFQKLNRTRFSFHNTQLSSIVENSFHAVAIDEHRSTFEATLWHTPKFKRYPRIKVEQVWFPGAHADIGGGDPNWQSDPPGRQDIAYDWMVGRLVDCVGLDFAESAGGATTLRPDPQIAVEADIHRPWGRLDGLRQQACRAINQTKPRPSDGIPLKARGIKVVGLAPYEDPIGEMIHISALTLLDPKKSLAWEKLKGRHPYRSPNLIAVLPLIASTYRAWDPAAWQAWARTTTGLAPLSGALPTLFVADWDGAPIPAQPQGRPAPGDPRNVFTHLGSDPANVGL